MPLASPRAPSGFTLDLTCARGESHFNVENLDRSSVNPHFRRGHVLLMAECALDQPARPRAAAALVRDIAPVPYPRKPLLSR